MRSISKVFLDANVLFDLCITDIPSHGDSVRAVEFLLVNGAELYTSSDFITTIYCVLSKILKDKDKVLAIIEDMVSYTTLIRFSNDEDFHSPDVGVMSSKEFCEIFCK